MKHSGPENSRSESSPSEVPKPCRVFSRVSKGYRRVPQLRQEMAWEIALWVRRRSVYGAFQDPEYPREIVESPMSHTDTTCSRRDFSLLVSTPRVALKAESWFWNEIWSSHRQFCTSFSVDTEEGQCFLFSDSYVLATNTYLHEVQHYQGFLTVS